MNKRFMRLLFSLFALIAWSATSVAQTAAGDGWKLEKSNIFYTLTITSEEGFAGVSECMSYDVMSVVIAEGVESIPKGAFMDFAALTSSWSVTIPASLTFIGDEAFSGCNKLTTVNINSNDGEMHVIYLGEDENGERNAKTASGKEIFPEGVTLNYNPLNTYIGDKGTNENLRGYSFELPGYYYDKTSTTLVIYDEKGLKMSYATTVIFTSDCGITSIPAGTFQNCTSLTEVKNIPTDIESIGEAAFCGCRALKSIDLSGCTKLTSIGTRAFENCTALETVKLPASLESIGASAFGGCTALGSIDLSGYTALSVIGMYAFCDCDALKSVKLPASLTSIEQYAFNGCDNLTYADLSECTKITKIYRTFDSCKKLKTVILPAKLTTIDYNTFTKCSELDSVILLSSSVPSIDDYAFNGVTDLPVLYYNEAITDVSSISGLFSAVVPIGCGAGYYYVPASETSGTLTILSSEAFGNISGYSGKATKVVFAPGCGVTSIPEDAFKGFSVMAEVTGIPAELGEIGENAFNGCVALKSIDLSGCAELSSIGGNAFNGCTSLESAELPASLTTIGEGAFGGCGLTSIDLSGCTKLTSIGTRAFVSCTALETVKLPASLESIGESAFGGCTALGSIDLSGCTALSVIGMYAFCNCDALESVKLPASLTTIGKCAFCLSALTSIDLSGCTKLTEIGNGAFSNTSLETIKLPASLTFIDDIAFANCTKLEDVYIDSNNDGEKHIIYLGSSYDDENQQSVKNTDKTCVGQNIFPSNNGLTLHYNPLSTYIGDKEGENLRAYFSNFPGYYYDEESGMLVVYADNGFDNAGGYKSKAKSLTVIDPVSSIPEEAFRESSKIESVALPASLETIGRCAFDHCENLTQVDFSKCSGLTTISSSAFYQTWLSSVDLGGCISLKTIEGQAFQMSQQLSSVILPDSLENIGDNVFNDCNLSHFNFPANIKTIGSSIFSNCEYTQSVKELTLPASLVNISNGAFENFENLEKVTIESDSRYDSENPHIIILGDSNNDRTATGTGVFSNMLKENGTKLYYNTENTYIGDTDTENIRSYFDNEKINYDPTSLQFPTTTSGTQYYDLNGRRVSAPVHNGVTVRRQEGKSSLIIVK